MENIVIQTSQNVGIDQQIASIGERIVATILDIAFMGAYMFMVTSFFTVFQEPKGILVFGVPVLFYHLVSELAMDGQSWGKKIMKIKVVNIDGSETKPISFFLRWVFRLIDILILFGGVATVTIILNGKGQRLGDIAANTTVIRLKEDTIKETLFVKLPADYKITFPEVKTLSEQDLYIIKEVLQHLKATNKSMKATRLADKTKIALEGKMNIKAGMRSEFFLFTLIRDYNYINSR